jgi:ribokinase
MFDVITIGAGTRDVFLVSDKFVFVESSRFDTGVGECVALGSKIELDTILHTTGGGATNAATTFARLGFKTAAICKVGDDSVGRDVIIDLHREGVDTTLVKRVPGGMTGYSTLLTAASGERTVLVYRGVSAQFGQQDIPWSECSARWIYVTSLAGNVALMKKISNLAERCGADLAWNPGSQEIGKGLSVIRPLLGKTRIVNMNREEAEKLTKKKSLKDMLAALATRGNVVLVTDGENGAYAHLDGKTYFCGTRKSIKAVSRTGAGDAFGSGFVAGWAKSHDLKTALAVATLNAQSVIQHVGAKAGILRKWPTPSQIKHIPIKAI